MPSTVVVGGFFGDEGKGKIISYLAQKRIIHQLLFVEEQDQMLDILSKMADTDLQSDECYQADF